ncbi:flagellar basal body P-ring formation chaperone FlgA [Phenylobacterium montanum]|uniref:Flagellar basal body P-ring formation protein FlgA n=1 Tax=Phenylobacterium montanum TaxID=2823693 RepID=A0A975G0Q9_9CAUL|nr:flagellar basal body P-ring formation chaperone FlgA [Caulobacter sp. S6]QUD87821.1 flagellar basal body P-ring formation protein FlgA [Caulobacter sp. S6]
MSQRILSFLAGAAIALAAASAALAGEPVSLRPDVASGRTVTLGDLFEGAGAAGEVMVGYGAPAGQSAVLDAGEVQAIARQHGLDWANPQGLRRIVVRSDMAGDPSRGAPAGKMIDALTWARNIAAGEIIQPTDLTYAKVPSFSAPGDMPRDADALIGKAARRPLRAGSAAAMHDAAAAEVIKRDDVVQVSYQADGISLILTGKAMAAAHAGEPVAVMNTVSKKVLQAIAIGPDQAVVGPAAEQYRAAFPSSQQFAAR